jgi:hypothetical protein
MNGIPEEFREKLSAWAAVKVEMRQCRDKPEITDAGERYAENDIADRVREIQAARPGLR